jgi:Na+/proline symporter
VRTFFSAAWWFLLGAFLMHMLSAYVLQPVLMQPTAAEVTRSFFSLALVALGGLIVVGIGLLVLFLKRRREAR